MQNTEYIHPVQATLLKNTETEKRKAPPAPLIFRISIKFYSMLYFLASSSVFHKRNGGRNDASCALDCEWRVCVSMMLERLNAARFPTLNAHRPQIFPLKMSMHSPLATSTYFLLH